jgi:hypothetical protein
MYLRVPDGTPVPTQAQMLAAAHSLGAESFIDSPDYRIFNHDMRGEHHAPSATEIYQNLVESYKKVMGMG